jgi:cytochrome oxidase assembly protein ShyY1
MFARLQIAAAMIAAVAVIGWGTWQHGRATERAAWQARVAALTAERNIQAARIIGQAEQIARLQAERDEIARGLENEARQDPDAGRVAIPADSVRRINRR